MPLRRRWHAAVRAGAKVTVGDLSVTNEGWSLAPADSAEDEFVRMRGYQIVRTETLEHVFTTPGSFSVPEP